MEMTKNNPIFQIENSITKGNVENIKQIHLLLKSFWK